MRNQFLILLILLLFSCSEKKEEIPSDVLSKEKYVSLMVDMYLLEASFVHANIIEKPAYEKGIKAYQELFKKHGTDKKQVEKSIDYYSMHPNDMRELQSAILDSLNLRSKKK